MCKDNEKNNEKKYDFYLENRKKVVSLHPKYKRPRGATE